MAKKGASELGRRSSCGVEDIRRNVRGAITKSVWAWREFLLRFPLHRWFSAKRTVFRFCAAPTLVLWWVERSLAPSHKQTIDP